MAKHPANRELRKTPFTTPIVLEDLRRLVEETKDWSPVNIVDVEKFFSNKNPFAQDPVLVVSRGRLAGHRKQDFPTLFDENGSTKAHPRNPLSKETY